MKKLGILITGRGSNFEAIAKNIREGKLKAEIAIVISNKPDAKGIETAHALGLNAVVIPSKGKPREQHDAEMIAALKAANVDLVCLAGYMRLLTPPFIQAFPGRILNIHPSLLPQFPGLDAQKQALEAGVKVTGCTVHYVDELLDHGPIILQKQVPVLDGDTEESLSTRILEQEHNSYWVGIGWAIQELERGATSIVSKGDAISRIYALTAVTGRAWIEENWATKNALSRIFSTRTKMILQVHQLNDWMQSQLVTECLSGEEKSLLSIGPGNWDRQMRLDGNWRVESLGVLYWAMNAFDAMPPFDTAFDKDRITEFLPLTAAKRIALTQRTLRNPNDLGRMQEVVKLWHWRLNTRRLIDEGRIDRQLPQLKVVIENAHELLCHLTGIRTGHDDFWVFNKPFNQLSPLEMHLLTSITIERHHAINWLCGQNPNWDEIRTDTTWS